MSTANGRLHAFLCDGVRTPIGRYAGVLAPVRPDDLGAVPLAALMKRNLHVDWEAVDNVFYGCANQAGEDNRNVARMSLLLAGLPECIPGSTINRLCGSGLDAIAIAAHAIRAGRCRSVHRGRRREHEPSAVRYAEGRRGVRTRKRGVRYDDRLAFHQSGLRQTLWRR